MKKIQVDRESSLKPWVSGEEHCSRGKSRYKGSKVGRPTTVSRETTNQCGQVEEEDRTLGDEEVMGK